MLRENTFIWSDNWWVEDNSAWFVGGENNALFRLDLKLRKCDFEAVLPNNMVDKFRLNSKCIKFENDIFCMPNRGDCIWVYQLNTSKFYNIKINNPNKKRILIVDFWVYEGNLYVVSAGLKQIIEISLLEKRVINYYNLTDNKDEKIALSTKAEDSIYCVSSTSNRIFQFDLKTKSTITHTISVDGGGFHTICFDGERFWLSGHRKEVYIWNKESNIVKIINNFPKQFGIYNFKEEEDVLVEYNKDLFEVPAFIDSVAIGQYIWFIPFQTNKIVYIDKATNKVYILETEGEEESANSLALMSRMKAKYLLLCVLRERYLVLYSLKNNYILTIDIEKKEIEKREYWFSDECLNAIAELKRSEICREGRSLDEDVYKSMLYNSGKTLKTESVGLDIHKKIMQCDNKE